MRVIKRDGAVEEYNRDKIEGGLRKALEKRPVPEERIQKLIADIEYAHACDCSIKLVGRAKLMKDGRVWVGVYPALVKKANIISGVSDVFNAIMVRGDSIGDVMFYGRGAGKLPTASAVVADVIDCVKHLKARRYLSWEDGSEDWVAEYLDEPARLYVRACCTDYKAAVSAVSSALPGAEFIELNNQPYHEVAFVTPSGNEQALTAVVNGISSISDLHILHILN